MLIEMCFICGTEPDPEMGSWYNQHFRKKPTDFDANLHGAAVHDVSAGLSCNNCRNKARRAGGLAQLLSSKLRLPMVARTLDVTTMSGSSTQSRSSLALGPMLGRREKESKAFRTPLPSCVIGFQRRSSRVLKPSRPCWPG